MLEGTGRFSELRFKEGPRWTRCSEGVAVWRCERVWVDSPRWCLGRSFALCRVASAVPLGSAAVFCLL